MAVEILHGIALLCQGILEQHDFDGVAKTMVQKQSPEGFHQRGYKNVTAGDCNLDSTEAISFKRLDLSPMSKMLRAGDNRNSTQKL